MIDYEKLLDALKTIQDECAKYKFCTDCPFFVHSDDKNSNDFFTPSDVSHVKDTFKIVPAVLVDIREALCKECAQKEGK